MAGNSGKGTTDFLGERPEIEQLVEAQLASLPAEQVAEYAGGKKADLQTVKNWGIERPLHVDLKTLVNSVNWVLRRAAARDLLGRSEKLPSKLTLTDIENAAPHLVRTVKDSKAFDLTRADCLLTLANFSRASQSVAKEAEGLAVSCLRKGVLWRNPLSLRLAATKYSQASARHTPLFLSALAGYTNPSGLWGKLFLKKALQTNSDENRFVQAVVREAARLNAQHGKKVASAMGGKALEIHPRLQHLAK